MKSKILSAIGAVVISLTLGIPAAEAAQLKVFVGGAMTETVEKIGAEFAKASGNKLEYVSDTTGALQKRLQAGEKADVVVVTAAGLDAMQKENRIAPGTRDDSGARADRSCDAAERHGARFVFARQLQGSLC